MTTAAPEALTETATELEIGCECQDHDNGCGHPADLWVIFHDLLDDCRTHADGNVSMYLCTGCWTGFSTAIDGIVAEALNGRSVHCACCDMRIRVRTDVVRKVVPLRGVKR